MLPLPDRWFFMTGCQRSGTTLLRFVLECHPAVFCFDELDSYRVLACWRFEETILKQWVGFKIPRWAEQLDYDVLRDFGLPDEAKRIYHGQKILFMVRDYRDTISSMLKLPGAAVEPWVMEWAEPTLRAHMESDRNFPKPWTRELAACRGASNYPVAVGAVYWKFKNTALLRYAQRGYPVLAISYERLVTQPEEQLRRVCAFLGIEFTDEMLHHPAHPHREILENGLAVGNSDPTRLIDSASVGHWRKCLEPKDVALAQEIAGPLPDAITPYLA